MPDFTNSESWNPGLTVLGTLSSLATEIVTSAGGAFARGGAAWPSANRAIFVPVVVSAPITIVKMFIENATTVSGNVDVGIYTTEGVRLVSSGTTAHATANGLQIFDITDTLLNPGLYYLAMAMDNTTATPIRFFNNAAASVTRAAGVLEMASAFVLPNPATFAASSSPYAPNILATGQTVI